MVSGFASVLHGHVLGLLALVLLVDAAFAATFLVALQAFVPEIGGRAEIVGYTLGAFGVAKLMVQLFSGLLADRRSPRSAVIVGLLLCVGAAGWMVLAPSAAMLPLVGAIYGAGNATLWPALYSLAASSSDEGGRAQMTAALALTTGLAVGLAVLGGSLVTDFVSGRATLTVSVALLLGALALAPRFAKRRGSRAKSVSTDKVPPGPASVPERLLARRVALGLLITTQAAAVAGMVPIIGPFARGELGIEFHVAVIYLAPAGVAGLLGLLVSTKYAELVGRPALALGGVVVAGGGALALALAETPSTATLGASMLALGYGALFPAVNGMVMDYAGIAHRGTLIGWFMAAEGLGHALGPAATGLVLGIAEAQAAVVCSAGLFGAGAIAAAFGLVLATGLEPRAWGRRVTVNPAGAAE